MKSVKQNATNSSISYSQIGKNLLNEPEIFKIQRDVDFYTKKLEQEKKKLFGIQETHKMVSKELQQKKERLQELEKQSRSSETKNIPIQIKNLTQDEKKTTDKLNEIQNENKKLIQQINKIRKERVSFLQLEIKLQQQIKQAQEKEQIAMEQLQKTVEDTNLSQKDIFQLKIKQDQEEQDYIHHIEQLQYQVTHSKKQQTQQQNNEEIIEGHDSTKILSRRIQRLTLNNKDKVKAMEEYKKKMKIIEQSFDQIKESTGIKDLNQIAENFIQNEEQNYSLYNFVNMLNQEIDQVTDQNLDLEDKIKEIEDQIQEKFRNSQTISQEQMKENQIIKIQQEREKMIQDLYKLFQEIQPDLLVLISGQKFAENYQKTYFFQNKDDFQLTETNVQFIMGELEDLINIFFSHYYAGKENNNMSFLDNEEKREKKLKIFNPNLLDDVLNNNGPQDMLDRSKLEELAQEICVKNKNLSQQEQKTEHSSRQRQSIQLIPTFKKNK